MAVVTITITDDENGGCNISAASDPLIPDDDEQCTPAQIAGAVVMRMMDAMVKQATEEGHCE